MLMSKVGIEAIRKWVTPCALTDPDVVLHAARISVWGHWFIWLVGVFLLSYRPGFWYPEDIEFLSYSCPDVYGQRPCPPSAPDEQARDMALDAFPKRHGHCPDHGRNHHPRLGSTASSFVAYYPALAVFAVVFSSHSAQFRLDYHGRRQPTSCRVLDGRFRSGPGRG